MAENYHDLTGRMISGLEAKNYHLTKPCDPLDFALVKRGTFQTWVVAVRDGNAGAEEPKRIFERTEDWFTSLMGNNGGGLLLFVYPETPAWALEQIKSGGSGMVKGGVLSLNSNFRWITSHLGWDREIVV